MREGGEEGEGKEVPVLTEYVYSISMTLSVKHSLQFLQSLMLDFH